MIFLVISNSFLQAPKFRIYVFVPHPILGQSEKPADSSFDKEDGNNWNVSSLSCRPAVKDSTLR